DGKCRSFKRMSRVIRVVTSVPLAARVLVLGLSTTAGLTMVASAREAVEQHVPLLVEAPPVEVVVEAPPPVWRVPTPIPWQWSRQGIGGGYLASDEGAIPEPPAEPAPAEVPAAPARSRFTLPLRAWTAVTDRFGAPRGPGY